MPKTIWDIEGVADELKKLVGEDRSASQIADILTFKFRLRVSRNGIIGKVHRLGLKLPNSAAKMKRAGAKARRQRKTNKWSWGSKSAFQKPAKPKKPVQAILETAPIPEAQPTDVARISFLELDPKLHCSFIPFDPQAGDPLHSKKYCGLPIANGSPAPYCLEHLRRCYPIPDLKPRTPSPFRPYVPASKIKEDA